MDPMTNSTWPTSMAGRPESMMYDSADFHINRMLQHGKMAQQAYTHELETKDEIIQSLRKKTDKVDKLQLENCQLKESLMATEKNYHELQIERQDLHNKYQKIIRQLSLKDTQLKDMDRDLTSLSIKYEEEVNDHNKAKHIIKNLLRKIRGEPWIPSNEEKMNE